VEACEHQNGGWRGNNWLRVNCKCDPHRLDYCKSIGMVLVPRERKPSLLKTMARAQKLLLRFSRYVPSVSDVTEAGAIADALAEAIAKEKSDT